MSAIRENFVRSRIYDVLKDTVGVKMPQSTLKIQVNLGIGSASAITDAELETGLSQLKNKGRIDFKVDDDDDNIRLWWITTAGLIYLGLHPAAAQ